MKKPPTSTKSGTLKNQPQVQNWFAQSRNTIKPTNEGVQSSNTKLVMHRTTTGSTQNTKKPLLIKQSNLKTVPQKRAAMKVSPT